MIEIRKSFHGVCHYYIVGSTAYQNIMTERGRGPEASNNIQDKRDGDSPVFVDSVYYSFIICLDLSKPESYLEEVSGEVLHERMKELVAPWMEPWLFSMFQ